MTDNNTQQNQDGVLRAEEVDGLLMAAVENLRSPDKDERRVEAAFRIASELEKLRITLLQPAPAQSREDALRAECFALAADQCHAGYGDEWGNHRCKYQDEIAAIKSREDALREALERTTTILDAFGNLPDEQMSPEAWIHYEAEDAITAARAALRADQGGTE